MAKFTIKSKRKKSAGHNWTLIWEFKKESRLMWSYVLISEKINQADLTQNFKIVIKQI